MTKYVLDNSAIKENFFADAAMIGIVSGTPGYRLCWILNQHFEIDFTREPDQNTEPGENDPRYFFPTYQYDFPGGYYRYLLYKLKNGKDSLLPETKQYDYLWFIQTANPEDDADLISAELRNINEIQLTRILLPGELKNLLNLVV